MGRSLMLISRFAPSYATLFAALLALLAIVVSIMLSQSDMRSQPRGLNSRFRARIAKSLPQKGISNDLLDVIVYLLQEIDLSQRTRATISPIALFYISVKALAILGAEPKTVDAANFSYWINTYLNVESKGYSYPGLDLYNASCQLFCGQGGNDKTPDGVSISYSRFGEHGLKSGSPNIVQTVSVPLLMQDLDAAIRRFADVLQSDQSMMARADSRLGLLSGLRHFNDIHDPY
jgi:hypothetical protein